MEKVKEKQLIFASKENLDKAGTFISIFNKEALKEKYKKGKFKARLEARGVNYRVIKINGLKKEVTILKKINTSILERLKKEGNMNYFKVLECLNSNWLRYKGK